MIDTQQQLAALKQRIAAIDRKFSGGSTVTRIPVAAPTYKFQEAFIDQWAEGSVITNEAGAHFQTERLYPAHRPHGSADIGALRELPPEALSALHCEPLQSNPGRWAFLDTETTGLAGGSGTYAFLIGVGRITEEGFRVRQFFMRDYIEERSMLLALEEHLSGFDVLVTYNGKSYDAPLLETRFRMARRVCPLARLPHVDLLHGARRIWKLRLESCRLMELEREILGFEREGDVPGDLIPYIYFEYLRSKEACRVMPILHHNAVDILTLACLSAIVPLAFQSPDEISLRRAGVRRGEDLCGIARWLLSAGELEPALALLRRAVQTGLPDTLLFRSLWDIAQTEKKLDRTDAAITAWTELAACRNEYRVAALEELAKYYEHSERNYAVALDFTDQALRYEDSAALRHRRSRLERRLATPRPRRLL